MTTPVEKKLPGRPIPREELIAEWRELQHRNLLKGVLASFMFDVYYSTPDKTYQWRVQFDCGCVRDVLTRDRRKMTADDPAALGELADSYHFGLVRPSERESREQKEYYDNKALEDARASSRGEEPSSDPRRPLVSGEDRLPNGQFLCHSPDCTRYQQGQCPVGWWTSDRRGVTRSDQRVVLKVRRFGVVRLPVSRLSAWRR